MASILIVDDDKKFAEQLVRLLASAGHESTVHGKGEGTVEALADNRHQLLILDIMLPDVSGFEVCRRIRRDGNLFSLPIVMLSSMNGDEEVAHGLAQGADDYVPKPCDPQALLQRVNALLRTASEDKTTDGLTGLPSGEHTKRELQRRLVSSDSFALAYFELMGLRQFAFRSDQDARLKAVRHLGRALEKVGGHVFGDPPFVGHMGGGHFVSMTVPDKVVDFAEKLRDAWLKNLMNLYQAMDQLPAYHEAVKRGEGIPLDLLCCITRRDSAAPVTPKALFETVSQIRQRALATGQAGIYLDQREFGGT